MSTPYIGEIRIFAGLFAPYGWLFCDGSYVPISQYQSLYSIIGNIYGDPTSTTFKLPNIQAYGPIGQGTGPGLTPRVLGEAYGATGATISENNMPSHTHAPQGANAAGNSNDPTGRIWAKVSSTPSIQPYGKTVSGTVSTFYAGALSYTGGGLAHNNIQPSLCVNFIIAWDGEYPQRS